MDKLFQFLFFMALISSCKTSGENELNSDGSPRSFPNVGINCCFDSHEKHGGYSSKIEGDDDVYVYEFTYENFFKNAETRCHHDYLEPLFSSPEECNLKPKISYEESKNVLRSNLC